MNKMPTENKIKSERILFIDFDELIEAFEFSSENLHFFIDLEKNEILDVDEMEYGARDKLNNLAGSKYLAIPKKESKAEFEIMELFIYGIQEENFDLAEKFHKVLEGKHPFRNFKQLLKEQGEELEMKWYKFRENEIKNKVINWLCENNLQLNQTIIPKIEIKELNRKEAEGIIDELKDFWPMACMKCHNKSGLKQRFFSMNVPLENALIEKEVRKELKEKYGIERFGNYVSEKSIIVASKCPMCGSENIFWDY